MRMGSIKPSIPTGRSWSIRPLYGILRIGKRLRSLVSLLLGLSLEEVQLIFAIYQGWSSEALEALVDGSVKDILWDLQGTKCTEDCHCCCLKETGGK